MGRFSDVLTIINGKNQKGVENPHGKYPIYGSGGIMGYADDFICNGQTVIIGRKGSINKPIFVDGPFWNVDTAFGLSAQTDILLPKYLYYFCEKFDFEQLNTTVTIPSLTKANLLNIEIKLPSLSEQEIIVRRLDKINSLTELRKQQLAKLDELVKARFVEMFGDYRINDKGFEQYRGGELFKFSSGKFLPEEKRKEYGIPAYGGNGIAWYTDTSLIEYPTIIIGRVGAQCGNIHLVTDPVWISDNAIYIKEQKTDKYRLEFLSELMIMMDFYQYADFSGQPKITQKPLEDMLYLVPSLELQGRFSSFVERISEQKLTIQRSLDKLEVLKKPLMQKYFG